MGLPHTYTAAGALYGVCPGACIYYFGLSWWAIWFQFIILVTSIPVGVSMTAVALLRKTGLLPYVPCQLEPQWGPQLLNVWRLHS